MRCIKKPVAFLLGLSASLAVASPVHIWETTAEQAELLSTRPDQDMRTYAENADISSECVESARKYPNLREPAEQVCDIPTIRVDARLQYQRMIGFGATMTDASAYVLMHDMTDGQRDALLDDLFGAASQHFSFIRLSIGASDNWRGEYSYDDRPKGQSDSHLDHFSIEMAQRDLIPVIKMALARNPQLTLMATPWSPPGWMKTTDSMIGGTLKPTAYDVYAAYLVRYVRDMAKAGVPVSYLATENEPDQPPDDYPGMELPPAKRALLIGKFLGPQLAAARLATKILEYDNNWYSQDSPGWPLKVLADARARRFISGIAWHCYGGDVSAQSQVHQAYPEIDTFFTECTGIFPNSFADQYGWQMKNLIIGATRNWARTVLMWNVALDEDNGPHEGGCYTCRGIVTVNSKTGAVTRNLEYYVLGHASRFVQTGAVRIESNEAKGIVNVAYRNPDGSRALIAYNSGERAMRFRVAEAERHFAYELRPGSAATFVWSGGPEMAAR